MDLDKVWQWQKKKLSCRIRPEEGNPMGEGLREMLSELAGVDLNELLSEMKTTKKRKEQKQKVLIDHEGDKTFKEVLFRSRVMGASKLALDSIEEHENDWGESIQNKNKNKIFQQIPKSPPPRVLRDIQRERSKPLRLPAPEEQAAAAAKLERKLAKQRAARMAAMDAKNEAEESLDKVMNDPNTAGNKELSEFVRTVIPAYEGDQFGVQGPYLEGMMYLSRMADSSTKMKRKKDLILETHLKAKADAEEEQRMIAEQIEEEERAKAKMGDEFIAEPDINTKRYCAMLLSSYSRNPKNAPRLKAEGAVRAIMSLALESDDRISMFCCTAFRNMSACPELAISMIDENAVATMSDVMNSRNDDFTLTNIAIALVNLTRVNGREGQLVGEAAIVLALMNLVMVKQDLAVICVRGLYNVTCVDAGYQFIERVIRALVSLSLSGIAQVKHICAASLCNLSDMKSCRTRMVEEGVVNVLQSLSRGAEKKTRRVCAVILQNLSASKSIRVEMGSRSSVTAAYALSADADPIILRCIGLTLARLAMEPANCQRIIQESGISALCNIAVKYPTIPGISQPVAAAFQLLSSHTEYKAIVASEGSVTAIASLLLGSVDLYTLQQGLLALCNLLCDSENHSVIIQQGLIITLIELARQNKNDLVKDFCALAFLNLSCWEDSRKHIVNAGAIKAIILITQTSSIVTQRRCTATLCNISYFTSGMNRMVSDGIIPAVVGLVLSKDIPTVHYACAALCHLCCTVDNAKLILESGAIANVVAGAMDGDVDTKLLCGAVLSSLSFYDSCRLTLCELGAIKAMKGLADHADEIAKQRCLIGFANLSCESSVQAQMIDDGVVEIISQLANSNQEINFICCAKAMCNLACNQEKKLQVAIEGGVHALLLIAMVKSVDRLTKLLCIVGLNNLIDDSTIDFMINQELLGSIANISRIGDTNIENLCVRVFNRLSKYSEARVKTIEKEAILNALVALTTSNILDTKMIGTRTCCNLLIDPMMREVTTRGGILAAIENCFIASDPGAGAEAGSGTGTRTRTVHSIAEHAFSDTPSPVQDGLLTQCLAATMALCSEPVYMERIGKSKLPYVYILLVSDKRVETDDFLMAIKLLAIIARNESSRVHFQTLEFFELLIKMIGENFRGVASEWIAALIRFLSIRFNQMEALITGEHKLLETMHMMSLRVGEDAQAVKTLHYLIAALRNFCHYESVPTIHLMTDLTMEILYRGCEIATDYSALMYNVACVIYMFVMDSEESKWKFASSPLIIDILTILKKEPKCHEFLAVIIADLSMDRKIRKIVAKQEVIDILVECADLSLQAEAMNSNIVLAILSLAKFAEGRNLLLLPDCKAEKMLVALYNHTSPIIKANISRTLKAIKTDPDEMVEEGTIAGLVAMCMEGRITNRASETLSHPTLLPQKGPKVSLSCEEDIQDIKVDEYLWFDQVSTTKGGAAGKGPDPPDLRSVFVDGSKEFPSMSEEIDTGEAELKTKMSFAKMSIPEKFKEACLLPESEFEVKLEEDASSVNSLEDPLEGKGSDGTSLPPIPSVSPSNSRDDLPFITQADHSRPEHGSGHGSRNGSRGGAYSPSGMSRESGRGLGSTASSSKGSPISKSGESQGGSQGGGQRYSTSTADAGSSASGKTKRRKKKKKGPMSGEDVDEDELSMVKQAQRLGLYA